MLKKKAEKNYHFKSNRVLSFLLVALGIFFLARFISIMAFSDPSLYFLEKKRVFLVEDSILQQRFITTQNNLTAIGLIIDKSSLFPPPGNLVVSLKDADCQNLLARKKINLLHTFYSRIPKMTFPTIANSENKALCFEIAYEAGEKNAREGEFINVWKSPSPQFSKTTYTDNGEVIRGYSLIFKPYYTEQTTIRSLAKLTERMSQYKPDFLKGKTLLALMIVSFVLSYAVALILLLRSDNEN